MPKVPVLVLTACTVLLGIVVPNHVASADKPSDVEADATAHCDELAAQGYDTTDCVETYIAAYNGEIDLGADTSPYFDEAAAEIELPCKESVEYQQHLEDPALPDPCAVPPAEPDPCGPVLGESELEPDPCPVPDLPVLAAQAPPKRLTWRPSFATKLYIANFAVNQCGTPTWVKLAGPKQLAAYSAFCLVTAQSYKENPLTPLNANPLDARIWARADLDIVCEENKAVPVAGALGVGGTAAGREVGPFGGVVEQPRTRNQIATNGGFGFVTWGRPNPALEPGFLAGGPRTQPNIWNKVSGTVTCKTAAGGVLSASITPRVEGTGFPSHKVWWNGKLNFARAQGSFSVLWDLPGVPQA